MTPGANQQHQQTLFRDLELPEFIFLIIMQFLTMHLLTLSTLMIIHQQILLNKQILLKPIFSSLTVPLKNDYTS